MIPDSITKRILWNYVNQKIKYSVHSAHVFSVVCLLFEEIISELVKGKEIKIVNFGVLKIKKMNPKNYYDVRFQKMMRSNGNKIFRFTLVSKLKKKLCENLDLDKTFGSD